MYKRMLRSALAVVFSVATVFAAASAVNGVGKSDISWDSTPLNAAPAGDISWDTTPLLAAQAGDISWDSMPTRVA